jgi:formylglycine-generating enzyme required for sulfatase activity
MQLRLLSSSLQLILCGLFLAPTFAKNSINHRGKCPSGTKLQSGICMQIITHSPTEVIHKKTNSKMVSIVGSCFEMGSNGGEELEKPAHKVCLKSYKIDEHEITQAEYLAAMGTNPSLFLSCGENCPVEQVSWDEAKAYCELVNKRLPTEAEWEYAAKGAHLSKKTSYAGSENLNEVAWSLNNSNYKTSPVCLKKKNEIGLCDMSGNVAEWVADWTRPYIIDPKKQEIEDDIEPEEKAIWPRGIRGGSWNDLGSSQLTNTLRRQGVSLFKGSGVGFRCVSDKL